MVSLLKKLGIIAFAALIGLFFVSCGDDSDSQSEITLTAEQIIDGAPIFGSIIISRSGAGFPVTYSVSVDASGFDQGSIRWEVAGVGSFLGQTRIGLGSSFTLDADDIIYNSIGGHVLTLTVSRNGTLYQRAIPFTIYQ